MHFPKVLAKDNTDAREEVLNHRLLYELKIAAAERGYHLMSYRPEVDHDGFDVILDDRDALRKIQLKSVVNEGSGTWRIHKGLLRPSFRSWEGFGFDFTASWGTEGAVVLIDVVDKSDAKEKRDWYAVDYLYTDIYYISLLAAGVFAAGPKTIEAANRVRKELSAGKASEKTEVPRGLFLPAKNAAGILALAGLHSLYPHGWQAVALKSIRLQFDLTFKLGADETKKILNERTERAVKEANGETGN